VAIINSVISLYYYARIIKTMFFDFPKPSDQEVAMTVNNSSLLGILATLTVILGVYWGPLFNYTNQSLRFFIK
jgi:NADH-quinone oxidoreductase subunit N